MRPPKLFIILLLLHAPAALGFPTIVGYLLSTSLHETGHAVTAAAYGYDVQSFRPYPTVCGRSLAGGCVEYTIPPAVYQKRKPALLRRQGRVVSMAGSGFASLGVLAFTPLVQKLGPGYVHDSLDAMLDWGMRDMLLYTIIDSVTDFQGDWYSVAESLGIPTWYLIAPAALNYFGLKYYRDVVAKNSKGDRKTKKTALLPQIWIDKDQLGIGVLAEL